MKEVEICCSDTSAILEAAKGGAQRVEICTGITDGGLTPPASMVRLAKELGIPSVNVLIRTRPGDFVCSDFDLKCMLREIEDAVNAGATGIVCGALTPDGKIDIDATGRMIEASGDCEFVFHRAIDLAADPIAEINTLIDLGCDRVLTSGGEANAEKGIQRIAEMVRTANGRIKIMAGSGVNLGNVERILSETGADAIHSTARSRVNSVMTYHRPGVSMGAPGSDEYSRQATDRNIVQKLVEIAANFE